MVNTTRVRRAFVAAALLLAVGGLHASSTRFFTASSQADFLRGELENLAVDSRGQLLLGPASELVYETASPFLWTVLPAPDGSLYAGTGNDGRVYHVDPQGRGRLFFDATELEIHALAAAPNGGLYAASSPDGKIYRLDRNGAATTFFDPPEKYIWALAVDPKGIVYAAAGDKGVVYRITPDGNGTVFYDTKATHATALAFDKDNTLYVGTESPGRVLRVDGTGRGFVLLDSPYQEIRTLRFDDAGMLYVAAANGRPTGTAAPTPDTGSAPATQTGGAGGGSTPTVSVSTEVTAVVVESGSSSGGGSTRPAGGPSKGGIYRIAPDGLWDLVWDSREDLPYDLAIEGGGRLIVATGDKGKIYRLEGNPVHATLLARATAQQVTALHRDRTGRVVFATANPGKLSRLAATRAPRGTYESEVLDAEMVASWGAISWRGTAAGTDRLDVSTRSGNTETPDDTWSPWSAPYASSGAPITSPKARYLQWRVTLSGTGDGPVLTSVAAAYLQRNLRPVVRSVTVQPPGIVFQKPYSTGDPDLAGFENQSTPQQKLTVAAQNAQAGAGTGRRTYQKGLQTLQWRAEDGNEDELTYAVHYRREGESTWTLLRDGLSDTILVWDTTTVPDGTYIVRVGASDAPNNAPAAALTGELESTAFDVDNTPAAITGASARVDGTRTIVAFEVRDNLSAVQRVEYSLDGVVWRGIFPADGMADGRNERYEVAVDGRLGSRGLTVRAIDAMNNVATAHVDPPAAAR